MNFWRKGVGWEWIFVIARSLELQALPYALNPPPRAAASFNDLFDTSMRGFWWREAAMGAYSCRARNDPPAIRAMDQSNFLFFCDLAGCFFELGCGGCQPAQKARASNGGEFIANWTINFLADAKLIHKKTVSAVGASYIDLLAKVRPMDGLIKKTGDHADGLPISAPILRKAAGSICNFATR